MGESAVETVREIEETRDRLDADIRELEDRLPSPALWTKRAIGVAVGGGVSGAAFWFVVRRRRKRRAAARIPEGAATVLAPVVNVVPDDWAERVSGAVEDGRWRPWVAGAAGAWLLLRLAELRQLRRMNRALVAGR